jgi:hypothetical protein
LYLITFSCISVYSYQWGPQYPGAPPTPVTATIDRCATSSTYSVLELILPSMYDNGVMSFLK